jgi:hypothetical protein
MLAMDETDEPEKEHHSPLLPIYNQFPGWRIDSKMSYSDWVIEITPLEIDCKKDTSATMTSYHVHKYFLGVGSRSSSYFRSLFKLSMKEAQECKTILKLVPSASHCFPFFLDFVYTGDLAITVESAVALAYLGDYFGVKALKPLADSFIEEDIKKSRNNVNIYCQEAITYKNMELLDYLIKKVGCLAQDDLLAVSKTKSGSETPVQLMMKQLSEDQRNRVYFHAFKAAHTELSRFKPVEHKRDVDKYCRHYASYSPDQMPEIKSYSTNPCQLSRGNCWYPVFYYDNSTT